MNNITRTVIVLCGFIFIMFGFTFSLIPLYSVFCKVTGLNGKGDMLTSARLNTAVNSGNGRYRANEEMQGRIITIEFDASIAPDLPFEFSPDHAVLQVTPGQLNHTSYYVKNNTNQWLTIQAIPSISPGIVAKYLRKLECFCFSKQTLKPYESAHLPLRFWLEPEFPDSVHRLTLSYTVFDITNEKIKGE